jgi:hypothetical protein
MTHKFPTASAQLPCRVARVRFCAPALRGTAAFSVVAPDASLSGTSAKDMGRDYTRSRAILAGGDP